MQRAGRNRNRLLAAGACVLAALLLFRYFSENRREPGTGRRFEAVELGGTASAPAARSRSGRGLADRNVGVETPAASTASLVVRTISRRTLAPVAKARISMRDAAGKVKEDLVATDDGIATLRFQEAAIATTTLAFEADGFEPRQIDLGDAVSLRDQTSDVAVVGLSERNLLRLAVRCANGCNVDRAKIFATSRPPMGFPVERIPPSTPLVRAAESGLWEAHVTGDPWVGVTGLLDSHPDVHFALDTSKESEGRVVEFACGPVVHGRIAFPDGRPASGILVELYGADQAGEGNRAGVATVDNGSFWFDKVFRPETVVVDREPKVLVRLDPADAKKKDIDLGTLTIAADDRATLKVEGVGGSQVALALSVSPKGSDEAAARQSAYDGVFRVPHWESAVQVRLMDEYFGGVLKEWSLDAIPKDMVLDGRGSLGSVSFSLPSGGGEGVPPETPHVRVSRAADEALSARVEKAADATQPLGRRRFEVKGLPVGAYSLQIQDITGSVTMENVVVRGDKCTALGLLDPHNELTVSGRILSKAQFAVPGLVTADLRDAWGNLRRFGSIYCDGTFRFAVAASSVVVLVAATEDGCCGQIEVEVRAESIKDIVLRVGRPTGLVVNILAGGKLVVGRPVVCWTSANTRLEVSTDTSGAATFRNLPPGRTYVYVGGAKRTFTLAPETVETVVIDIGDDLAPEIEIEGLPKNAVLVRATFIPDSQSVCDFALTGINCEVTAPRHVRLPSMGATRGLLTLQVRGFSGTFAALIDPRDTRRTCDVSATLEIRALAEDDVAPIVSVLSIDGVALETRSALGMRTPCIASGPQTYVFALPTGAVEVLVRAGGRSEKKSFHVGVGERVKAAM